jgi:hypothetical protein
MALDRRQCLFLISRDPLGELPVALANGSKRLPVRVVDHALKRCHVRLARPDLRASKFKSTADRQTE